MLQLMLEFELIYFGTLCVVYSIGFTVCVVSLLCVCVVLVFV